jgi:hypothetical protein
MGEYTDLAACVTNGDLVGGARVYQAGVTASSLAG